MHYTLSSKVVATVYMRINVQMVFIWPHVKQITFRLRYLIVGLYMRLWCCNNYSRLLRCSYLLGVLPKSFWSIQVKLERQQSNSVNPKPHRRATPRRRDSPGTARISLRNFGCITHTLIVNVCMYYMYVCMLEGRSAYLPRGAAQLSF